MTTTQHTFARSARAARAAVLVAVALLLLAGCGGPGAADVSAPTESAAPAAAATDAEPETHPGDGEVDALLDEVWAFNMRSYPTWATYEGDRRYDDALTDVSSEARAARRAELEAFAVRMEAIDPSGLSPMARDTRRIFLDEVVLDARREVCRFEEWAVDGLGGPQADYPMMAVFFSIRDEADVANLEARYRATAVQVAQRIANLRAGLADGLVGTRANVERAIDQLDRVLATPVDESPMLGLKVVTEGFEPDTAGLRAAVADTVRPALEAYRAVLVDEILPAARAQASAGLSHLPIGAACYAAQMEAQIGPGFTPEALHQVGIDELAEAHAGMLAEAAALGIETTTVQDAMVAIAARPDAWAESEDQLLELNRAVVARAKGAMEQSFGRLPQTPVEVRPIEAHRAPDAPAAYYYSADEEGTRPGVYYVNTFEPEKRPLYNLEALAFHEAIPGHHLQIAIAKELPAVHIWRRNAGQTAFVEGWALYAELLADEQGLYSTPLTRFGMHNYQAWRAARLVVDTGLHHMGWSRDDALAFMRENVLLPEGEITNEVDRYITWPGQALAYMVGRREIRALRAEAEAALGERFDVRAFHDAVLGSGAVTLVLLRDHIEAWIEARRTDG